MKGRSLQGCSAERPTAGRITGIGCYGKPMHVARTLARALSRFGLTSSDTLYVAWRRTSRRSRLDRETSPGQRCMPGGEAVAMLARHERATGFFLSTAHGRPRLQVR